MKGILVPSPIAPDIKGAMTENRGFQSGLPDYEWFLKTYSLDLRQEYENKIKCFPENDLTLQGLNDFAGFTFNQLADIIEEHVNKLLSERV